MKRSLILFIVAVTYSYSYYAQATGKALEIVTLINAARTNPVQFLAKHKTEIKELEPKFIIALEKASVLTKITWDKGLEDMAKAQVNGNLNPSYKGSATLCGFSGGSGSGYSDENALYFVCDFYTNVLDPDISAFGFYSTTKSHAFYFGNNCGGKKQEITFQGVLDTSKVDFNKLNTGKGVSYLNEMDVQMIREINFVRHYPKVYAKIIEQHLVAESKSWGVKKAEYDAALELIAELNVQVPLSILKPMECLYQAAKIHGLDCKKRGFLQHEGSDGSDPFERIKKYCKNMNGSENLVGGGNGVRAMVINLLIDSGISSRGHRYNMLNPIWKYIGCYGYIGQKNEYYTYYEYVQKFATD